MAARVDSSSRPHACKTVPLLSSEPTFTVDRMQSDNDDMIVTEWCEAHRAAADRAAHELPPGWAVIIADQHCEGGRDIAKKLHITDDGSATLFGCARHDLLALLDDDVARHFKGSAPTNVRLLLFVTRDVYAVTRTSVVGAITASDA